MDSHHPFVEREREQHILRFVSCLLHFPPCHSVHQFIYPELIKMRLSHLLEVREILGLLDHLFLPFTCSTITSRSRVQDRQALPASSWSTEIKTGKFYCLFMEYCSGGNLHSLDRPAASRQVNHGARSQSQVITHQSP